MRRLCLIKLSTSLFMLTPSRAQGLHRNRGLTPEKEIEATPLRTPRTPRKPGTPKDNGESRMCFVALIENNSREVGLALFNVMPPYVTLYQFTDTALYSHANSLLELHRPTKIIVPTTVGKSPLAQMIATHHQERVAEVARGKFSDVTGGEMLMLLADMFSEEQLQNRYLAVSAVSAALSYAQSEANIEIMHHTLNVKFKALEGHLLIDSVILRQMNILSVKDQEAVRIMTPKRRSCLPSLFNLVDCCRTPSGARCLRASLASPSSDLSTIVLRQNFLEEIVMNADIHCRMTAVFSRIIDLDPAITFLVTRGTTRVGTSSMALDCMRRLSKSVGIIGELGAVLGSMDSDLAQSLAGTVGQCEVEPLGELIHEFLEEDAGPEECDSANQFIRVIRKGISLSLDVTRATYDSTVEQIYLLATRMSEKYEFKINVRFNRSRRYYLSISKNQLRKKSAATTVHSAIEMISSTDSGYVIPSELIHVVDGANNVTGTTYELLLLNKQSESSENDSILLSNKCIEAKMDSVRSFITSIYKMSEVIAFVDALLSLATIAREYEGYHRPNFSETRAIVLRQARDPVMEQMMKNATARNCSKILHPDQQTRFVPNDIELTDTKPMIILKGVNMSGKSTVLQTIVRVMIIAQCGGFIPCTSASMFPVTSILGRGGTADSLEGNASAFAVEMREMGHITTCSTATSLVVIDEPCVSTSVRDGVGLGFACLEELIAKRSFVLCATHFSELEILSSLYSSVTSKEMRTRNQQSGNSFEYTYQLADGCTTSSGYGIKIASPYLPDAMLTDAASIHEVLSQVKRPPKSGRISGLQATSAIIQKLTTLRLSSLDNDSLCDTLVGVRRRCAVKQ